MDKPTEYISKESVKKRLNDLKLRAVGIRTNVLIDAVEEALNAIPAEDVVESAKRTTFKPDSARDLKDFVQACEIDDGIMGGFEADRMKTYLYALIDEATIGFDWGAEEETPEQRGDRHFRHIMEMQRKKA